MTERTLEHKDLQTANKTAFLIIGVLESAWAPLIPFVKSAFTLDEGEMGLLMLCTGIGSLAALPFAGRLCVRFGPKPIVYVAAVMMALCLLSISLMAGVWVTAAALVLFGCCTIVIDVSANVNGISVEHKRGRHLMSGFHGGYSLGTLIGAAAMSILFALGLVPVWAVAICIVLTLALMMWGCRDLLPKDELLAAPQSGEGRKGRLHIPPLVIVVGLLCFIMYAAEGAVLGWSAIFVSQERGVDIRHAGFFYTAFAVAMTSVRLCGDKIVDALGRRHVVVGGALLVAAGFLCVVLVPNVLAAALGFAMIGIGAGNIVPQIISFAGSIKGMAVQDTISLINALGFSGILLGPVVIGFIAKHYELHTSFMLIALLAFVVAGVAHRILQDSHSPSATRSHGTEE